MGNISPVAPSRVYWYTTLCITSPLLTMAAKTGHSSLILLVYPGVFIGRIAVHTLKHQALKITAAVSDFFTFIFTCSFWMSVRQIGQLHLTVNARKMPIPITVRGGKVKNKPTPFTLYPEVHRHHIAKLHSTNTDFLLQHQLLWNTNIFDIYL